MHSDVGSAVGPPIFRSVSAMFPQSFRTVSAASPQCSRSLSAQFPRLSRSLSALSDMQYMAIPQGAPPVSLIEHCRSINKMAELQLETSG